MTIFDYFASFILFFAFVMFLSVAVLRLTLDRRVRSSLASDKVYDAFPDHYLGFGRAIIFAAASVMPWSKNSWVMTRYYDGFNVAAFASRFEKFVAYTMVYSTYAFFIMAIFFCFTKWLGIIEWPDSDY